MASDKINKTQSDRISTKVMVMFAIALGGILLLMFERRLLTHGYSFMIGLWAIRAVGLLGIAGVLFGLYKTVADFKAGKKPIDSIFTGLNILGISLILIATAAGILMYDFTVSLKLLYVLYPAAAVLYLIFQTYPREMFCLSAACATGAPFLWMMSRMSEGDTRMGAVTAIGIFLLLVEAVLMRIAYKRSGLLGGKKVHVRLISKDGTPAFVFFMLLFMAAALLAARFIGTSLAFYAMIAAFVYLFVMAVFYTVKMM